jgi:hypothetical protein
MGTDKAITLTEPFTKLTSSKGRRLNARRVRGSEPQRMENALGRARMSKSPICQIVFSPSWSRMYVSSVQTSARAADNSVLLGENQFSGTLASRRHKSKTRCKRFATA